MAYRFNCSKLVAKGQKGRQLFALSGRQPYPVGVNTRILPFCTGPMPKAAVLRRPSSITDFPTGLSAASASTTGKRLRILLHTCGYCISRKTGLALSGLLTSRPAVSVRNRENSFIIGSMRTISCCRQP